MQNLAVFSRLYDEPIVGVGFAYGKSPAQNRLDMGRAWILGELVAVQERVTLRGICPVLDELPVNKALKETLDTLEMTGVVVDEDGLGRSYHLSVYIISFFEGMYIVLALPTLLVEEIVEFVIGIACLPLLLVLMFILWGTCFSERFARRLNDKIFRAYEKRPSLYEFLARHSRSVIFFVTGILGANKKVLQAILSQPVRFDADMITSRLLNSVICREQPSLFFGDTLHVIAGKPAQAALDTEVDRQKRVKGNRIEYVGRTIQLKDCVATVAEYFLESDTFLLTSDQHEGVKLEVGAGVIWGYLLDPDETRFERLAKKIVRFSFQGLAEACGASLGPEQRPEDMSPHSLIIVPGEAMLFSDKAEAMERAKPLLGADWTPRPTTKTDVVVLFYEKFIELTRSKLLGRGLYSCVSCRVRTLVVLVTLKYFADDDIDQLCPDWLEHDVSEDSVGWKNYPPVWMKWTRDLADEVYEMDMRDFVDGREVEFDLGVIGIEDCKLVCDHPIIRLKVGGNQHHMWRNGEALRDPSCRSNLYWGFSLVLYQRMIQQATNGINECPCQKRSDF